jgi:hypothetical protein
MSDDGRSLACFHLGMQREAPVTVKQMYAIAAGLCKQLGQKFPSNRGEASDLIEKLRKGAAT